MLVVVGGLELISTAAVVAVAVKAAIGEGRSLLDYAEIGEYISFVAAVSLYRSEL